MYTIVKNRRAPQGREPRRTKLDGLVALANQMEVGDAAEMLPTDAQTFRIILAAQGFRCVSDGWNQERRVTLIFKLSPLPTGYVPNWEI